MVLIIATAGLVYELAMAAVASEELGDSVRQFSIVIGVYLSALGLGAYLSRFIGRRLHLTFVDVELSTAVIGGLSAPALQVAAAFVPAFSLVLYAVVVVVGVLVGLELPLLIRILEKEYELKELIARALTFDYAGALVGSLSFSLLLRPLIGTTHATIVCGILNAVVGLLSTWFLVPRDARERRGMTGARVRAVLVCVVLVGALAGAHQLRALTDQIRYGGKIALATQSTYQRIIVTRQGNRFQLHLNGNLQFSSDDEHRYHEALVHPAMIQARSRRRVLVGGGGDGLAAREILKWPDVETVTLVDLDGKVTQLATEHPLFTRLNRGALADPRVKVVNADAFAWFEQHGGPFDVILLDFPDPTNYSVGKLYSKRFYHAVRRLLAEDGVLAVQSTSPLFARHAYWCVVKTLRSVGFHTRPYAAFVPAFGEWGFTLATHTPGGPLRPVPTQLPLRFLDDRTLAGLFVFPDDMSAVSVRENRLDDQALVSYYLAATARYE